MAELQFPKLRDELREKGIELTDQILEREIVFVTEDGKILERHKLADFLKENNNA